MVIAIAEVTVGISGIVRRRGGGTGAALKAAGVQPVGVYRADIGEGHVVAAGVRQRRVGRAAQRHLVLGHVEVIGLAGGQVELLLRFPLGIERGDVGGHGGALRVAGAAAVSLSVPVEAGKRVVDRPDKARGGRRGVARAGADDFHVAGAFVKAAAVQVQRHHRQVGGGFEIFQHRAVGGAGVVRADIAERCRISALSAQDAVSAVGGKRILHPGRVTPHIVEASGGVQHAPLVAVGRHICPGC